MLFLLLSTHPFLLNAQQVNSLYFMENAPIRQNLNPAFQPTKGLYVSLPIVGYSHLSMGNNSLRIKDVIYNRNGQTITFLHPDGDINKFYNTLKPTTNIQAEIQTNLVAVGFSRKNSCWHFSLTEKMEAELGIPKDFFKVSLYGTPDAISNSFDFGRLQSEINVYTEAALGYSKTMDKKWTGGIKLKFLYGTSNMGNRNTMLALNTNSQQMNLEGKGWVHYSGPAIMSNDFKQVTYPKNASDWLKPSGVGGALDVGLQYDFQEKMRFSAAITDLGFIRWSKNIQNTNYEVNYSFDGIKQISNSADLHTFFDALDKLVSGNELVDSLTNAFQEAVTLTPRKKDYSTATRTKINVGAEYLLYKNRLSIGLLSRTIFLRHSVNQEITSSVNVRPYEWLHAAVSYSMLHGGLGSIGMAIGLRTGFIHWFAATDYFPFQKTTLSPNEINPDYPKMNIPLPYNSKNYNIALGMTFVFDPSKKQ